MKSFSVKVIAADLNDKYLYTIDTFKIDSNGLEKAKEMGLKKFYIKHKKEKDNLVIQKINVEQIISDKR